MRVSKVGQIRSSFQTGGDRTFRDIMRVIFRLRVLTITAPLGLIVSHSVRLDVDGPPAMYVLLCVSSGILWCFLYAFVFRTTLQARKGLLFLLPLGLVAFVLPVDIVSLFLALGRGGPRGDMP